MRLVALRHAAAGCQPDGGFAGVCEALGRPGAAGCLAIGFELTAPRDRQVQRAAEPDEAAVAAVRQPAPRAGWVSMLLLESLRNAVEPPSSRTYRSCTPGPTAAAAVGSAGKAVVRSAAMSPETASRPETPGVPSHAPRTCCSTGGSPPPGSVGTTSINRTTWPPSPPPPSRCLSRKAAAAVATAAPTCSTEKPYPPKLADGSPIGPNASVQSAA